MFYRMVLSTIGTIAIFIIELLIAAGIVINFIRRYYLIIDKTKILNEDTHEITEESLNQKEDKIKIKKRIIINQKMKKIKGDLMHERA